MKILHVRFQRIYVLLPVIAENCFTFPSAFILNSNDKIKEEKKLKYLDSQNWDVWSESKTCKVFLHMNHWNVNNIVRSMMLKMRKRMLLTKTIPGCVNI